LTSQASIFDSTDPAHKTIIAKLKNVDFNRMNSLFYNDIVSSQILLKGEKVKLSENYSSKSNVEDSSFSEESSKNDSQILNQL